MIRHRHERHQHLEHPVVPFGKCARTTEEIGQRCLRLGAQPPDPSVQISGAVTTIEQMGGDGASQSFARGTTVGVDGGRPLAEVVVGDRRHQLDQATSLAAFRRQTGAKKLGHFLA